jgi:hypothetical protein
LAIGLTASGPTAGRRQSGVVDSGFRLSIADPADSRWPIAGARLSIADSRLPIADARLSIADSDCRLSVPCDYQLPIAACRLYDSPSREDFL